MKTWQFMWTIVNQTFEIKSELWTTSEVWEIKVENLWLTVKLFIEKLKPLDNKLTNIGWNEIILK